MDVKKGAGNHLQKVDGKSCYSGGIVDSTERLDNHYKWAVQNGFVSSLVSLEHYRKVAEELNKIAIGKKASDGTTIKHITFHCVDRVCGTIEKQDNVKHEGINLTDFEFTLFHGEVRKGTEENTIIFISKVCRIAINPKTGVIKQCNKL